MVVHQESAFSERLELPELGPLDAAVARARVLLHRRALWLAHLVQHEGVAGNETVLRGDLCRALLDLDNPDDEQRFARNDARASVLTSQAERLQLAALEPTDSPFRRLAEAFGLKGQELDLVQLCVAVQLDPSLGLLLEHVTRPNERRYPTEPVVARVYGHGRQAMRTPMGALERWHLIVEEQGSAGEAPPLKLDPFVQGFLSGAREFDPVLWPFGYIVEVRKPLAIWHVEQLFSQVDQLLGRRCAVRLVISGSERSGRRTLAAWLARSFGATLFAVDTDRIDEPSFHHVVVRARRQALLHGSTVVWHGDSVERVFSREHAFLPLEFVALDGVREFVTGFSPGCTEIRVEMPRLTASDRRQLWRDLCPACVSWPEETVTRIAERFSVQVGDVVRIASQHSAGNEGMSGGWAKQTPPSGDLANTDVVEAALRGLHRGKLGTLATLMPCPFRRTDLELSEATSKQLDELLFEASERGPFWDDPRARRLFPRGTGLVALLSGPPGTGKTMAAQVVAAELGFDLFRIDLATTVSKYIGETAKHLKQLFLRAAEMDAVLLFDEADALFAKRTEVRDAHDKHANADVSYLLQLVETYPGVALLATNRRQNMDDAFVRRIRYVLQFERPAAEQRRAIWHQVLSQLSSEVHVATLAEQLEPIVHAVDISGAQIKNAALAAAFFAREDRGPMSFAHIFRGLARELGNLGRELPFRPESTRERAEHRGDGR